MTSFGLASEETVCGIPNKELYSIPTEALKLCIDDKSDQIWGLSGFSRTMFAVFYTHASPPPPSTPHPPAPSLSVRARLCVCVCVCERKRERVCVCVCVCARARVKKRGERKLLISTCQSKRQSRL